MMTATKGPITVTAKTRKRCPACKQMIEVGESAVLTDDRYMDSRVQWFGRQYARGAWHLWHSACHAAQPRGA
jgi:hypothetical protein